MPPNRRGVDAMMSIVGHGLGECHRHSLPDAVLAPTPEAAPDAVPIAVAFGHVPPRRAGAQPPQHSIHRRSTIQRRPASVTLHRRQQLIQNSPFHVAQIPSAQGCLPRIYSLEIKTRVMRQTFCPQGLVSRPYARGDRGKLRADAAARSLARRKAAPSSRSSAPSPRD